jgi:hypothetical protein
VSVVFRDGSFKYWWDGTPFVGRSLSTNPLFKQWADGLPMAETPGGAAISIALVNPATGKLGTIVNIAVTGSGTSFSNGVTVASFSGAGVVVNYTTVSSATDAIVNVTISPYAAVGARDLTMTTGVEVVTATGGFTVGSNANLFPPITIAP